MFNLKMTKEEALKIQAEQIEHYGAKRPWLAAAVAIRTTADQLESGKEYSLETINRHIPRGGDIEFLIQRQEQREDQNAMRVFAEAQRYADKRGDDDWFCEVYYVYRETFGIRESAWKALAYLYSAEVANAIVVGLEESAT